MVDWGELYEGWFMRGNHDILDFRGRAPAFFRWLFDEGHCPGPGELREIIAMIDLVEGAELDARMAELAEEDWDVEALLAP